MLCVVDTLFIHQYINLRSNSIAHFLHVFLWSSSSSSSSTTNDLYMANWMQLHAYIFCTHDKQASQIWCLIKFLLLLCHHHHTITLSMFPMYIVQDAYQHPDLRTTVIDCINVGTGTNFPFQIVTILSIFLIMMY